MERPYLRIKEAIAESGFNNTSLAKAVGLSRVSISRIAAGEQTPSFDKLKDIADALQVEVKDLFVYTNDGQTTLDKVSTVKQLLNEIETDIKGKE